MKGLIGTIEFLVTFFLYFALWNLPFIFFFGGDWTVKYWLEPLMLAGWILLPINIVAVLPFALFKPLRKFSGKVLYGSSFIFAFLALYIGFILAYLVWDQWGAVIGILLLGVGVVPVGLLASAMDASWYYFSYLAVTTVLFFLTRFVGKRLQRVRGLNS